MCRRARNNHNNNVTTQKKKERVHHDIVTRRRKSNQQAHMNLQTTETDSQTKWMLSSLLFFKYEIKRKDNMYKE